MSAIRILVIAFSSFLSGSFGCSDVIVSNHSGCVCKATEDMLEISACTTPLVYPKDFNQTAISRSAPNNLAFRKLTGGLVLQEQSFLGIGRNLAEVRVLVDTAESVTIESRAFYGLIIHVVINGAKVLVVKPNGFHSCWGTVWIFNSNEEGIDGNAGTSSNLVIWRKEEFKAHNRPQTTPFQKFQDAVELAFRIDNLEAEMYALLATVALIIITLIVLTVVVERKLHRNLDGGNELPDVVPRQQANKTNKGESDSPVIRLSKYREKKRDNNNPRPPLPLPRQT